MLGMWVTSNKKNISALCEGSKGRGTEGKKTTFVEGIMGRELEEF